MAAEFSGQTAVISGGLGDIGRAIALELARRGADVGVGDILDPSHADPLLKQLTGLSRRARYDRVDVSDSDAVRAWLDAVEKDLGTPSLIVPAAAIVNLTPLNELTPSHWHRELAVNLDGAFHLAHAAAQRLVERRKPGRIVFIGSWAANSVHLHIPTYCVAKAGLRKLCQCMAAHYAPSGILVNEVAPGYVDAGLTGRVFAEHPDMRESARRSVPNRLLIEPHEVALQVAHLCDPANRHMVGTVLAMDGGLSLLSSSVGSEVSHDTHGD